jgi:hypothetical protein
MMAESHAVVLALVAGSFRALMLWRASVAVDVVNVVVVNALAEGRGSGSAPYLDVAAAIGDAALGLSAQTSSEAATRERLQHEARMAVSAASRRLLRHAWLDTLSLVAIAFAGLSAIMSAKAPAVESVGLAAATLLWLANVRGARSIGTRVYSGATALVASLLEILERRREFTVNPHASLDP